MQRFNPEVNDMVEAPYCAETMAFIWQGQTIYNPLRLPDDSGDCSPEFYGWEIWQTGGGCEAHGLALADDHHFLLTDDNGEPVDINSPESIAVASMGRYDEDGMEIAGVTDFSELPRNGSKPA